LTPELSELIHRKINNIEVPNNLKDLMSSSSSGNNRELKNHIKIITDSNQMSSRHMNKYLKAIHDQGAKIKMNTSKNNFMH